jgi:hypothetical protein
MSLGQARWAPEKAQRAMQQHLARWKEVYLTPIKARHQRTG